MSDEKKSGHDDLEYKPKEEHLQPEMPEPEPPEKRNIFSKLLTRRVIIVLVVVIAIFIVYQFISPKKTTSEEEKIPEQTFAAKTTQTADETAQKSLQTEDLLKSDMANITRQASNNEAQIKILQAGLQKANTAIAQLQNSYAEVAATARTCSTQCQVKNEPVVSAPVKQYKVYKKRVIVRPAVYHLKAIMPGRAWLQSTKGVLVTVKVGDPLKSYGVVRAINPIQGWVGTSSGKVIQYGPQDS